MGMVASTISSGTIVMERRKPTAQHLEALYDLINKLLPDSNVYYTDEELEDLKNSKGIELI